MDQEPAWFHDKWRPAMAWLYLIINAFDFLITPIALAYISKNPGAAATWSPLTLQGGGLFHISMLAIVGVTAWGRTQEKISAITSSIKDTPEQTGPQ